MNLEIASAILTSMIDKKANSSAARGIKKNGENDEYRYLKYVENLD